MPDDVAVVRYAPRAQRDLDEIWDCIEMDLGNPKAAADTVSSIMDRVALLANFPLSGTPLSSICEVVTDYRFVVSGNYLAFYRYSNGTVYVDRIIYAKRDYLRVLFER